MSESKHTPGPWTPMRNPEGNNCDVLAWDIFANKAPAGQRLPAQANSEANARLIAAAPELLEALEDAPIPPKYHGLRGFEVERFIGDYEIWRGKARTAIAKAKGEAA